MSFQNVRAVQGQTLKAMKMSTHRIFITGEKRPRQKDNHVLEIELLKQ